MIDNFIQNLLKLRDYELIEHKTGKDNITYEIICQGENFMIQQLSKQKSQMNQEFISNTIAYTNANIPGINFAEKQYAKRFFSYQGYQFQLMQKLAGKSIDEQDINNDFVAKTAQYIAKFHAGTKDFDHLKYSEINYFKKLKLYERQAGELIKNSKKSEVIDTYNKMSLISSELHEDMSLPIGVIHGDPSFKNFLVNKQNNIEGLIDYDMMSVNALLWDVADMTRSYLKSSNFDKKSFQLLVNSYNEIRKLSLKENDNLENYCKMHVLDTGFRYIISYFKNTNLLGGKDDCLKKAQRCLNEIDKLDTFFN